MLNPQTVTEWRYTFEYFIENPPWGGSRCLRNWVKTMHLHSYGNTDICSHPPILGRASTTATNNTQTTRMTKKVQKVRYWEWFYTPYSHQQGCYPLTARSPRKVRLGSAWTLRNTYERISILYLQMPAVEWNKRKEVFYAIEWAMRHYFKASNK